MQVKGKMREKCSGQQDGEKGKLKQWQQLKDRGQAGMKRSGKKLSGKKIKISEE